MFDPRQRLTALVLLLICGYFGASAWAGHVPETVVSDAETLPSPSAKPFVGELDGFVFYESSTPGGSEPPACFQIRAREATPEEVMASPLYFVPGYLPSGARELVLAGRVCGEKVVTVLNEYQIAGGGMISIARIDAPPRLPAVASRQALRIIDVGGKKAVLNAGTGRSSRFSELYIHAEPGYLYLSGIQVDVDELLRIAAGVRAP